MSEYLFGVINDRKFTARERARIQRIASKHGATFVNPHLPEGWRAWFAAKNMGDPFDSARSRAVLGDLAEAGITY